jgi:hypothetical protein
MIGDSLDLDVWGAEAAGIRGILLDRKDLLADNSEVERISSLEGLCDYLAETHSFADVLRDRNPLQGLIGHRNMDHYSL